MTPQHPTIVDAIKNNLQITFRYRGQNSTSEEPTERVVEPWVYGTKNGKESLYGYQVSGGTVGMRRFDMRRVKSVKLTGDYVENFPTDSADVTKWDEVYATTSKLTEKASV